MRAKEFIRENVLTRMDVTDPALPNAHVFPGVDQAYEFYRMGLDLAQVVPGSKVDSPKGSTADNNPAAFAYTDEEAKMLNTVAKHRGYKTKITSAGKSKEHDDTHKVSPVAAFKSKRRSK